MTMLTIYFILVLFAGCSYLSLYHFGVMMMRRSKLRARLVFPKRRQSKLDRFEAKLQHSSLYRNTATMLEAIKPSFKVKPFIQLTLLMLLFGAFAGSLAFATLKGVIVLGLIAGASPYALLRMMLVNKQMKARIDFLPALEVFYQHYVLSQQKNIRIVLATVLKEQRMMYPIQSLFAQLERNLSTQRNTDECLHIFSMSFGHIWASYFVNMLRVGIQEGIDISSNLQQLTSDMRKAQRSDQAERNKLLEIRIANFTPLIFLIVFLAVNFNINFNNAYEYYVLDPAGRSMLLDAMLLIFASFLMGIYLSIKRL